MGHCLRGHRVFLQRPIFFSTKTQMLTSSNSPCVWPENPKKNITQLRFEVFEVHCWIHLVKKPNRLFKDRQLTMTNDGDLLEVCFTMPSGCLFCLPVPNNPSAVATCASKSINLAFKRSIHLSCHDHCTQ